MATTNEKPIATDFLNLILSAVEETGVDIKVHATEIAAYAAAEASKLATAINEPGFTDIVRAARDNVALMAGVDSSLEADAADLRLVGIIEGGLAMAARALTLV